MIVDEPIPTEDDFITYYKYSKDGEPIYSPMLKSAMVEEVEEHFEPEHLLVMDYEDAVAELNPVDSEPEPMIEMDLEDAIAELNPVEDTVREEEEEDEPLLRRSLI